jgi:hypothetical protein
MAWYCIECENKWTDNAYASIPGLVCYYCGKQRGREWLSAVSKLIVLIASGVMPIDINALVQSALRESYLENNKDLQFYADKVQSHNDMKKTLREYLSSLRNQTIYISKTITQAK